MPIKKLKGTWLRTDKGLECVIRFDARQEKGEKSGQVNQKSIFYKRAKRILQRAFLQRKSIEMERRSGIKRIIWL